MSKTTFNDFFRQFLANRESAFTAVWHEGSLKLFFNVSQLFEITSSQFGLRMGTTSALDLAASKFGYQY
jgi:hypothetical protein